MHGRGRTTDDASRIGNPAFTYLAPAAKDTIWYPYGFMQAIEILMDDNEWSPPPLSDPWEPAGCAAAVSITFDNLGEATELEHGI